MMLISLTDIIYSVSFAQPQFLQRTKFHQDRLSRKTTYIRDKKL